MQSKLDISIVVVCNNHREFLERCLTSLINQMDSLSSEVFVVDNYSSDGSADYVAKFFPEVRLIAGDKKRGYSENNNIAIRESSGRYILLLNPDTEIIGDALSVLVDFMDTNDAVGICGPQLRFPDGNIQLSCRAFPNLTTVITRRTPLRAFLKNSRWNQRHLLSEIDHNLRQPVDWLLGACMMIRQEMFEQIGLLDERFYLYVEDIDICLRAYENGWQVYYVPDALVIHHHLAVSDAQLFSKHTYLHTKSMIHYGVKHKLPKLISFLKHNALSDQR